MSMAHALIGLFEDTQTIDNFLVHGLKQDLLRREYGMECGVQEARLVDFHTRRADMLDTKVGSEEKDDPAKVAKDGFKAMMAGEGGVVSGWHNKLEAAAAHVMPAERLAKKHTAMAAPATDKK